MQIEEEGEEEGPRSSLLEATIVVPTICSAF